MVAAGSGDARVMVAGLDGLAGRAISGKRSTPRRWDRRQWDSLRSRTRPAVTSVSAKLTRSPMTPCLTCESAAAPATQGRVTRPTGSPFEEEEELPARAAQPGMAKSSTEGKAGATEQTLSTLP